MCWNHFKNVFCADNANLKVGEICHVKNGSMYQLISNLYRISGHPYFNPSDWTDRLPRFGQLWVAS